MKIVRAAAIGLVLSLAGTAYAQETETQRVITERGRAEAYQLDTSVPEAPALALLGVDSANVATPRDVSSLGLDLANIVTSGGEIEPGLAITIAPYWFGAPNLSLTDYRADARFWERALRARTRFSFATAGAGGEDSDARRAAVGVTFQPLDDTDPRMDRLLSSCVLRAGVEPQRDIANRAEEIVNTEQPNLEPGPRALAITRAIAELQTAGGQPLEAFQASMGVCQREWRQRQERADNLLISLGYAMHSESGRFEDLEGTGATAWVGYSWAPGNPNRNTEERATLFGPGIGTRVNFYARFSEEVELPVDEETNAPAQESVVAVSANMIARGRWEFGIEGAYFDQDFNDDAIEDRDFSQVSVNASYRLNDSVWVRGAYGVRDNDDEEEFVRLSLVIRQRGRT